MRTATVRDASTEAEPFALPEGDADIVADFAAMGILFQNPAEPSAEELQTLEQTQREAMAARYLELAGLCDAECTKLDETRDLIVNPLLEKIARVTAFYSERQAKLIARRDGLLRFVEHLAALSSYPGKKKSIATPFGTFGYRDIAPTVRLVDEPKTLEWLRQDYPGFVQVTAKLPLDEAREYLGESQLAECKHSLKWVELKKLIDPSAKELPPGVEPVPGGREFYAKPETL
jgi:hypothetical protein